VKASFFLSEIDLASLSFLCRTGSIPQGLALSEKYYVSDHPNCDGQTPCQKNSREWVGPVECDAD